MLQEIPNLMAPEAVLAVVVHVPVVASLPAGPKVYYDVSYNPTVAGETAAIGVYL
jgi:hypothetical protein